MSQCKKFAPNIFHNTKCSNCFRQKEEHSAEALECNRASRSIARSGYLFVAPDWDFSVPLNRTKRWQRRWFVLYDDGELNYSVDEHPDTIPQGSVDMSKVLEVTGAEQVTGHPHSLALTSPDRVTFVKAASREDARWWAELLAVFPRRHKRNATFPGGRASPSLPQLGRSASPQPPRPRHLSCSGPSPRTNFETPPLKEERESPPKDEPRPGWLPEPTGTLPIETVPSPIRNDYLMSSSSPPTRDKLRCEDKARARRDWRNERLRDIATALTDRSPESSLALPAESLLHLKKGWLWLKGADDDFTMRWAVLCGPNLTIYRDQDEHATPEIVVEMSSVTSYCEVPTESKYGFEIKWTGPPLVLYAVTSGIRSNWLQALKKAVPASSSSSSESPVTPRSVLFSSDEEYRTASEGGRRGSEDWSEIPLSPPLTRTSLNSKVKATRIRPRLPRCQSRQSTLDSTSTDELDCVKLPESVELNNEINKQNQQISDLQTQLVKSMDEVRHLEEEIARLKKFQAEAVIQEKKAKEMMLAFERTERDLNQRNSQAEMKFNKEQRTLQRRLAESEHLAATYEEKCEEVSRDLQNKQRIVANLQEEVASINERFTRTKEENDRLYKRVQELEGRTSNNNRRRIRVDSLTELTDVDLDVDIGELGQNELQEYCLDLRTRFEKAVLEIRAVKRELREAHEKCDSLELANYAMQNNLEIAKQESRAEINLLVSRLEHLTQKLNSAEKQIRSRSKSESRDKRRSLSLKGRESFSINKEVEDKVTELEAKILALERGKSRRRYKRERSSERNSPIDDKSLRRLRRKSLDSVTSSEPMKLLMRLSTLESQVTNVNVSNESLNNSAKSKIDECLNQVVLLRSKRASPQLLQALEQNLSELNELVEATELGSNMSGAEVNVIKSSAGAVVKQLHNLLLEKLKSLNERKRMLRENDKLDVEAKLQILAEKVAYENILTGRIQEALSARVTGEIGCDRLINKEVRETAHLMSFLRKKLTGEGPKQPPACKTSADYLSKVLAQCLMAATSGGCSNFVQTHGPSIDYLESERGNLDALLETYKSTKLPQLAEALAAETLTIDKNCRLKKLSDDVVNDFNKAAKDIANSELIQSEINHVLLRAAQIYQSHIDADHAYFFTFFASERAALELWSDSVGDCLYEEINKSITELTDLYLNQLNKLQRQNWRRRVELERNGRASGTLLHEFADIIAHKALIDARIDVLSGRCNSSTQLTTTESVDTWLRNDNNWEWLENQSVQINQSLEAEFICMIDRCSRECYALVDRPELEQVLTYLNDLSDEIAELQKHANVPPDRDDVVIRTWSDVCSKCRTLRDKLEEVRRSITTRPSVSRSGSYRRFESQEEHRHVYLGTEYLGQVENLRAAYRRALASCKERHQESDIEQLQTTCERVLVAIEQWHRRAIQEMREAHAEEMDRLREEKEQALAEETQATLAALDAMRKAHEAEVQREVAKFKQDYARQQRDDILDLSERLSVKCLEAAALEEQLGSATRQLTHAQQHILQLERNPQLSPMQN